jgi:hypothetical protein
VLRAVAGGTPLVFMIKAISVPSGLSAILKSLKISARTKEISQFIDFAKNKAFTKYEAEGAAILEDAFGKIRNVTKNESGDFVFTSGKLQGKSVDLIGPPPGAMKHLKMKEFYSSLDTHFGPHKSDLVGLDLRSFSKAQQTEILDYVNKNFKNQMHRLLTITKNN